MVEEFISILKKPLARVNILYSKDCWRPPESEILAINVDASIGEKSSALAMNFFRILFF